MLLLCKEVAKENTSISAHSMAVYLVLSRITWVKDKKTGSQYVMLSCI